MGQGAGNIKQQADQSSRKPDDRKHKIIVSFTTTSSRIKYINQMLHSLFTQSMWANEINLWISRDSFLHDEGILPEQIPEKLKTLTNFNKLNFNIKYTENTAGYRKLLPVLEENRNRDDVVIITADDDTIYPENWIEKLYNQFLDEQCIIAYRARRITLGPNGDLLPYEQWTLLDSWDYTRELMLCPTGNAGVLYSPAFFDDRIFDPVYKSLSPTRADFWFAGNAIINNILTRHIPSTEPMPETEIRKEFPSIMVPRVVLENWDALYKTNRPKNDDYARNVFRYFSIID